MAFESVDAWFRKKKRELFDWESEEMPPILQLVLIETIRSEVKTKLTWKVSNSLLHKILPQILVADRVISFSAKKI